MRDYLLIAIAALANSGTLAAQVPAAVEQPEPAEITLSYGAMRANAAPGGCPCFWIPGGSAEVKFGLPHRLSAVAEASVHHTASINAVQQGLGLATYLLGLRYSYPARRKLTPFAQTLVGGVHGFDSLFPNASGSTTRANALAASFGGGLNLNVSRHFALRALQADYVLTTIPNDAGNRQNNLRLGAGIVLRIGSP
jgi:hypothetical protein